MNYNEVALYDAAKAKALIDCVAEKGWDVGCVYGVFYGMLEYEGGHIRWHIQLTPEQVNFHDTEESAELIVSSINNAMYQYRMRKQEI